MAAMTRNTKPIETSTSEYANLTGVLGSRPRLASRVQSSAKNGADRMMTAEFTDWKISAGKGMPKKVRAVCSSAKKFIEEPACSKTLQKKRLKKARMTMASTRCLSSLVRGVSAAVWS